MSEPQNGQLLATRTTDDHDGGGVRLELKPGFARTGFLDGGWWPRSRDLRKELPDLVAALNSRFDKQIGPVTRIGFGIEEWLPPGRKRLITPMGQVAFGGFDVFEPDVVWVATYAISAMPIALLVVPPETPRERATVLLHRASTADNHERAADLLRDENAADEMGITDHPAGAAVG